MAELDSQLIDALILEACDTPYRWGRNDCLTLALRFLGVAGIDSARFRQASDAAEEYLGLSYPEALALAHRRGATIGEVMLRIAGDLGLRTFSKLPEPPTAGLIAFAEGEIRRLDGHLHDTAKSGTLDLFFASSLKPFAWTTEGLAPYGRTFQPDFRSLEITGAIDCLQP